jgi:pimeloyl-ACP methyl ester carboxylesterase
MAPFVPMDDGSHLMKQWTKIRDMHRFFPWFDLRAGTRMPMPLPTPAALHDYSLDLFSAGAHFPDAYAAAMRYPAQAALAALRTPAVFCARPSDVLYPYLEALPDPLPPGTRVERLPDHHEGWIARLAELFAEGSAAADPPAFSPPRAAAHGMRRSYVSVGGRQLHVREHLPDEADDRTPLLLLHDLPGAACEQQSLLEALGAMGRRAILPDLPGTGDSAPLPAQADARAYGEQLIGMADQLGLERLAVFADFGSAGLALRLANDWPARIERVTLAGIAWLDQARRAELRGRIAPDIAPRGDGAHLVMLWHLLRDREMAWPWYDGSVEAIRGITPRVAAERLQAVLLAVLKQLESYGWAARASFDEDLASLLPGLATPLDLLEDAHDRRSAGVAAAAAAARHARRLPAPAEAATRAQLLTRPAP